MADRFATAPPTVARGSPSSPTKQPSPSPHSLVEQRPRAASRPGGGDAALSRRRGRLCGSAAQDGSLHEDDVAVTVLVEEPGAGELGGDRFGDVVRPPWNLGRPHVKQRLADTSHCQRVTRCQKITCKG